MIEKEIEAIKKMLKELNIPSDRIKCIDVYWEKMFEQRAFPKVHIELMERYKTEIKTPSKFESLPERVIFYWHCNLLYLTFGDNQVMYYTNYDDDRESVYRVTKIPLEQSPCTSKCHLELCKIEDLRAGDWFISLETDMITLFISPDKCFVPYITGDISRHVYQLNTEVKKVVYENTK